MSAPVELLVGPARSGKARRVLTAYLDALAGAGPGRALMLVPTGRRRRATESLLLEAQASGVLVRPQVLTMPDLADRLLTAAGLTVRRIGELARRHVIRRCLASLGPKEAGVLGPVCDAPGLVVALDALFRELKAARVEPDAFGRALGGGLRTPRNRVLAILYDQYQKALQAADVYDDAGQFWYAAALVARGQLGPFDRLALLAVDGFQDFPPAQLDVVEALSARADRTILTLLWDHDRPNLFGVTGRTRGRLRERFGDRLTEVRVEEASGLAAGPERVRTGLFHLPDGSALPRADGSLRVIRAAGRTREVEEAARRLVDLLRGGPVAAGRIAVLARSLDAYAPLVREVFPRYGIAFEVGRDPVLAESPVVRAAMALARLQEEDYSFRAVSRLLKSTYLDVSAFGADAAAARAALGLAREANVWAGRESYFRGLDYLRSRLRRAAEATDDAGELLVSPEDRDRRLAEMDRAEALLRRLFDTLALPAEATRQTFADRLREGVRAAGLWATAAAGPDPVLVARDLAALAALDDLLDQVAALDGPDAPRVPRAAFLADVEQGLGLAAAPAADASGAPVVVLDVRQARALEFDHVFLLGLAEKEFPRRGRRHPFFDDAQRQDLRRRGVDLADAGHAAEQEMLLFYIGATRATWTLTLGYPSLDAQGRPALASHYLEELAGLFVPGADGAVLPVTEVPARDLDLPRDRIRCQRERLAASMFALWGPGPTHGADEHLAVLHALLDRGPAAETALAGLAAEWEREHGEAFGPFDGVLGSPDVLAALCTRFPGGTVFSAGRLETYGGCPFAFLAGQVLGLEAAEEPSPDLGPLDVGLIYHGLLERLFSALAASPAHGGRVTAENRDAALALLDRVAEEYFSHLETYGRVGSAALWKVQRRTVLRHVRRLVDWHVERQGAWRAAYTEVPFGAPPPAPVRPPGRREPLVLAGPHGPVSVRGRIDRIDLAVAEEGYQVIDYKTGQAPSARDMAAGTSFQLPLYLRATAELLGGGYRARAFFLPVRGQPAERGRLASHSAKGEPIEAFAAALERAETYIHRFVGAMRQGLYPVYPRAGCGGRCDFNEICRFAEWRIQRKWARHPLPLLETLDAPAPAGEDMP